MNIMVNFNYDELSLQELEKIQSDVKKAIASYHTRKRWEAKAKVDELAKQYGYSSIEDLVSEKSPKKRGRIAQPYFRNPDNHEQTCAKLVFRV